MKNMIRQGSLPYKGFIIAVVICILIMTIFSFFFFLKVRVEKKQEQPQDTAMLTRNIEHAKNIIKATSREEYSREVHEYLKNELPQKIEEKEEEKESVPDRHFNHAVLDDEDFNKYKILTYEKFNNLDRTGTAPQIPSGNSALDEVLAPRDKKNEAVRKNPPSSSLDLKRKAMFEQALTSSVKAGSMTSAVTEAVHSEERKNKTSGDDKYSPAEKETEKNTLKAYEALEYTSNSLDFSVIKPKSPYALMQGSVIPAVLVSGISSELPGQISAVVSRDVRDSIYGRYLLIPKGSKLVGQYASEAAMGAKRLFLGFSRIIFPNGHSLSLGVMPGQGTDGYAGFEADVDNHFFKTLISCALLSSISTTKDTFERSHLDENGNITTVGRQGRELSSNIGEALSNLIEKNLNLAPTLYVKAGYNFNIALTKDIFFKSPYGEITRDYLIR